MNPVLGASLDGVPRLLAVLLVAFLGFGQPVLGWWSDRKFRRALRRDRPANPAARRQRYRRTMVTEWLLVALVLAVVGAAPGLRLGQLGLRWPGFTGAAASFTAVGLVGLVATVAGYPVLRRRLRAAVPAGVVGTEAVLAMLPRTFVERRTYVGLAVTAGICEETLYRGFLIAVAGALLPGLGAVGLIAVSAGLFGLAHLYQGPLGVLGTGVLGGCLATLYLGSGSLLLPVCYHVLLDLRVLLLPAPGGRSADGRHTRGPTQGGGGDARHRG